MAKESVRIQDDLFQAVNGEWLKKAKIPSDLPSTGGFTSLHLDVEKTLMQDFEDFANGKKEHGLPVLDNAVRLYKKALDVKAREQAGMKPLYPLLDRIKNIKNIDEFNAQNKELFLDRVDWLFDIDVSEDPVNDTSKQALMIMDPNTILPDKSLYENKLVSAVLIKSFRKMAAKLLKFSPLDKEEQKKYLDDTIAFDDIVRKHVKSHEELADYVKLINPMSVEEVDKLVAPYEVGGLLAKIYGDKAPKEIAVGNPAFLKDFKEILNDETFELFIHWTYVGTVLTYAPSLSLKIKDISNEYRNALMGVKKNPPIVKQAYRLVSALFSEPIGVYYGRKYFGEEAKKDVVDMTKKIIETYKVRIKANNFLEDATKEKAIVKLSAMKIKMGYPDGYDEFYDTLEVRDEDSYFDAMTRIQKRNLEHKLEKLLKPTNFNDWAMPGHMVNACYDPFKNDITFPAAILQKPFYSFAQSKEENLGGIGAVIGHEISHAFDNNGAHFDERGMLKDWWTEEDLKRFEALTKGMIEQWDGIPFHGGKVNGTLVVSENIADNGGMAVTIQIANELENPDFKAYFVNWAKVWCIKAKEKFLRLLLTQDVHSPAELRANMNPRNFKEWYDAFDVKDTDKMFIPEDKRIVIW